MGDIKPYKANSRTHSDTQVEQIAASITEFGFTNPILIQKGTIIAGHGRFEASKLLDLTEIPTIELSGLSKKQVKALVIADNKLSLNAGWDIDLLRSELTDLQLADFDVDLLGFGEGELLNILAEPDDKDAWAGMPEFNQPNNKAFRSIIVHLDDQESVDSLSNLLGQEFTEKTKYVWHPKQVKMETESKRYDDDPE